MSEPEDIPIDLSSIVAPVPDASTVPDETTRKEITKASLAKPTPSQLLERALKSHIQDVCEERRLLQEDIVRQRTEAAKEVSDLRRELDGLRPENSRLNEAFAAALSVNILSTIMVAVGGALISGAGFAPSALSKTATLWLGIGAFASGSILQVTATWRSVAFRRKR